eukprot:s59_g15.t1
MGGSQSAESEDDDPLITERFGSTPEQEDLWLLPARTLIEFHELLPFATLFSRRRLVKWTRDSNRTVVMISHQWSATGHPDPKMRQTAVLQQLLHHMASGKVAAGYQEFGEQETPSLEEQRRCLQWDLWYDYCCAELAKGCQPKLMRQLFHIVDLVIVLAPPLLHVDGSIMNLHTHAMRGWCLLEQMVATVLEKPLLAVTGPKSVFALSAKGWMQTMPHKAKFYFGAHQELVKQLALELLEWKVNSLHDHEEKWLLYTALAQRLHSVDSSRSLVSFWQRYHMTPERLQETSSIGFSPLMLACMEGNYSTVQLLLEAKANVNELRQTVLAVQSTALGVAAMASPAVVRCLLMARATCEVGNPMNFAVQFMNLETLNLLPLEECHKTTPEGDAPMNFCGAVAEHQHGGCVAAIGRRTGTCGIADKVHRPPGCPGFTELQSIEHHQEDKREAPLPRTGVDG